MKPYLILMILAHLSVLGAHAAWGGTLDPKASRVSCIEYLVSVNGAIVPPLSWERVKISDFKSNPYLLKEKSGPVVITIDGEEAVVAMDVLKLPTWLREMKNGSNDQIIDQWIARAEESYKKWLNRKDQATGLATFWHDTTRIREIASSTFYSVFDERLYDRITQQGRRFAVLSLKPNLGLDISLPPVSPLRISAAAPKAGRKPATPAKTVGLIFQRISRANILTFVEDNSFNKTMGTRLRNPDFKKFLDKFIDENQIPVSSIENPQIVSALFYSKQLTFITLMSEPSQNYRLELYRYRDSKNADHIVIESIHSVTESELYENITEQALKTLDQTTEMGKFRVPRGLTIYPFVATTEDYLRDILTNLRPEEVLTFAPLKLGENMTATFRFLADRLDLMPAGGYFSKSYYEGYCDFEISVLRTEKGLNVMYVRPSFSEPVHAESLATLEGLTKLTESEISLNFKEESRIRNEDETARILTLRPIKSISNRGVPGVDFIQLEMKIPQDQKMAPTVEVRLDDKKIVLKYSKDDAPEPVLERYAYSGYRDVIEFPNGRKFLLRLQVRIDRTPAVRDGYRGLDSVKLFAEELDQ